MNKDLLGYLDPYLEYGFGPAGILSKNLNDLNNMWKVFEFTKSYYKNFLVAHYNSLERTEKKV